MKIFLVVFSVLVVAVVAAVGLIAVTKRHHSAQGLEQETRSVSGFSRIEVAGAAEVTLRQGSSEGITIEAPARMLPRIRTEVRDRTLIVTTAQERRWWDWLQSGSAGRPPRIVVDLVRIERLESAGAVKFIADALRADELRIDVSGASSLKIGNLQASRLLLDGSGATSATLAGKVASQVVELSGAGSYKAGRLVSDNAELHVSGAGKALVNVSNSLKVQISGAGLVEYLGDPKIEQQISGAGKVRRRERD